MTIECIKSFCLDGGSSPILQGERFRLVDNTPNEYVFEGVKGFSLAPEMEISFTNDILVKHFKRGS